MNKNKDKIIELLKTESGLKGELINHLLAVPGMNVILTEHNVMPTLENAINEINKIHDEVCRLEVTDNNPSTKN